jgi:hypothetical protein
MSVCVLGISYELGVGPVNMLINASACAVALAVDALSLT